MKSPKYGPTMYQRDDLDLTWGVQFNNVALADPSARCGALILCPVHDYSIPQDPSSYVDIDWFGVRRFVQKKIVKMLVTAQAQESEASSICRKSKLSCFYVKE